MDDIAGAINRREVARDPYDVELVEYRQYLAGFRGGIARRISAAAKSDYAAVAAPGK